MEEAETTAEESITIGEEPMTEDEATKGEDVASKEPMKKEKKITREKDEEAQALEVKVHQLLYGHLSEADKEVLQTWANVGDYAQLLDLNRDFLCEKILFACYQLGPIYAETMPLMPGLLSLHYFGILTISSQPSKTDGPGLGNCYRCAVTWFFQTQHRAFLTVFLPESYGRIERPTLKSSFSTS